MVTDASEMAMARMRHKLDANDDPPRSTGAAAAFSLPSVTSYNGFCRFLEKHKQPLVVFRYSHESE